jgi:hypothetical protein
LRTQLVKLLTSSEAHVDFEAAIQGLPAELLGKTPKGAEHSPWELVEHLRFTQWDILDFSRNPNYKAHKWPDDYWPKSPAPATAEVWNDAVKVYRADLKEFCALIEDKSTDLFAKIPHGEGQTILREALLVADHTAYHVGQLVLVRRLLGAWN